MSLSLSLSAQHFNPPKYRWIGDLSLLNFNSSNQVVEQVENSPIIYVHKNNVLPACEISYVRQYDLLNIGLGISTNSSMQSFEVSYALPSAQGDINETKSFQFYRHMVGVHALVMIGQFKLEIGVRLGAYSPVFQNDCADADDRMITLINSGLGVKRAHLVPQCSRVERTLAKALTQVDLMYDVHQRLAVGIAVT